MSSLKPVLLAVEDNPTQRMLLNLLCKRFGFDVVLASCCTSAMDAFQMTHEFDLVLMDWRLNDETSGLDCAAKIREIDAKNNRHTPIIAMTASVMDGDKQACFDAGMDDYLSKPFSMEEFRDIVLKWVKGDATANIVQFPSAAKREDQVD